MGVSSEFREDLWFGVVFFLAGLAFACIGGKGVYIGIVSDRWPTVEGSVINGGMNYIPDIPRFELTYRYSVNGKSYEGWDDDVPEEIARNERRHIPGAKVLVHYDPGNPQISVTEPSFHWSTLFWAVVGVIMVAVGLFPLWDKWRFSRIARYLTQYGLEVDQTLAQERRRRTKSPRRSTP